MKVKSFFRMAVLSAFYIMVFFGTLLNANAQCPTIPTQPTPVCDASGFTFNDLNAFAVDQGNGIVWYDSPTGGSPFNSNEFVIEGTYYADDNSGTCGTRASIVIDFIVNPSGQNLQGIFCSNENATVQTYIDLELLPNAPSGGSVEVYTDIALTTLANNSDPITNGGTNYFIVFVDSSGCKSQIEGGSTALFDSPLDPTAAPIQEFCSDTNPTIADLDPGTTEIFNWYDNIDVMGDVVQPFLSLTTPLVDGETYYVQVEDFFCESNPVAVMVNIFDPVDAGLPGSDDYCIGVATTNIDLFTLLGGIPDTNGTWSGPLPTSNGNTGTITIDEFTPANTYVFTYIVAANGACPEATATVTITVYETFTSGISSALNPASFCEAGLPSDFDLNTLLDNEDPNGQWTLGTTSTDPIVTSPIDLTTFTPGTYNFTYTQNVLPNPCPEESTTVQVIVLQDPDAGMAVNAIFCENDLAANSPYDLFNTLDGSQDNNSGVWTDISGTTLTNPIDITTLTIAGSPYQFTYTINNGTCSDFENTTIIIEPAPESGTPVATFPEFCEGAAPAVFDLFDLLDNEDQTGIWFAGTNNTGTAVTNPIDLSGFTPGTYDFTFDVTAIGTCDDVLVTVQVTINELPNTGIPTPVILCENDLAANSPLDLFGQLAGNDAGGTWSDDDATGALTGNTVDLTLLAIGVYNFTYSITDANGCMNSSTVTITVEDAPESGTPVATFPVFCEGAAPAAFDLFDLLDNEDQTGIWFAGTDNTGTAVTNPIDLSGFTPGTYDFTFDVTAIGTCDDTLVTVQVTINALPNTGIATPVILCENDLAANSPLDLFGQLAGNDAGGTWLDDDATGALTGNTVDLTLLTIGVYNYTYSITDAAGCTNSSTVTITVEDAPEAGTVNGTPEFCLSEITAGQTVNLFDFLDNEDQTGTWSDNAPSGQLAGSTVTIDGLAAGSYSFTYDVAAIGTCDDLDMPTVTIIINETAAPTAVAMQDFCDAATVADLSATGNNIQWYDETIGGTVLAGTTALVDGETYYASQTDAVTNCESSIRVEVTVTITPLPNSGELASTPISVCNNTTVDLNTGLDGTQDTGGTWYEGTDATGTVVTGAPIYDVTGFAIGDYQFTYVVSATPCPDAATTITVTVQAPLDAGTNGMLDICNFDDGTTFDLFAELGGTPDAGGTWVPALASGTDIFDPSIDVAGTYTYFLTNSCGNTSSEVVVTVTDAPNAGADASVTLCVIDGTRDLFTDLGTDANTGGTWLPALASGTGVFDPTVDTAGVYTYTVLAVAPCTMNATAQVTVTVNDTTTPVITNSSPDFCLIDNPTIGDLDALISSTGTTAWYADVAQTISLDVSEALIDGEDYFVTQTNASGCESSTNATIVVTVSDAPTPTLINTNLELCINDAPTINELTLNIVEFNSTTNNVVWYDTATNGNSITSSTELTVNTTYYASLIDPVSGCESSVRLPVNPDLTGCGILNIPDGFSPNGDGVNDTFDMDNVSLLYPDFEMEIYNRYGNIVYKGNASTSAFNGKANQSRLIGSGDLPVGVYYYIFNFNNGTNKPEQGSLYLSR